MQARQLLPHQCVDNLLVNASANHVLKVVQRQVVLNQAAEGPESLLFRHDLNKAPHDKVETLAVAYMHVAIGIQSANPLDYIEYLLA